MLASKQQKDKIKRSLGAHLPKELSQKTMREVRRELEFRLNLTLNDEDDIIEAVVDRVLTSQIEQQASRQIGVLKWMLEREGLAAEDIPLLRENLQQLLDDLPQ